MSQPKISCRSAASKDTQTLPDSVVTQVHLPVILMRWIIVIVICRFRAKG